MLRQTDLSGSGISLITLQQLPAIAVSQEVGALLSSLPYRDRLVIGGTKANSILASGSRQVFDNVLKFRIYNSVGAWYIKS